MNECGVCGHGKPHGRTMIYCTMFGIDIRTSNTNCKYHQSRITETEDGNVEIIKGAIRATVRKESPSGGKIIEIS